MCAAVLFEQLADALQFRVMLGAVEPPAHQLETQIDEEGIEHIGFTIIADISDPTLQVARPDLVSAHAQLPRQAEEYGDLIELRRGPRLETSQHVHHVGMPPVITAEIVVPTERLFPVAGLPVAGCGDMMPQCAVMQDRQIETGPVPGHQIGRIPLDAVEKALDQLRFVRICLTEAPQPGLVAGAQQNRNRDHPMLMQGQEITTGLLAALGEHDFRHRRIVQFTQTQMAPPELYVRDRLDIEYQTMHRFSPLPPPAPGPSRAAALRPRPPAPPRRSARYAHRRSRVRAAVHHRAPNR